MEEPATALASRPPSPAAKKMRGGGGGFDWQLEQHCVYEPDMLMSGGGYALLPHRQRLLQNCDLPPPAKIFSPLVAATGYGDAGNASKNIANSMNKMPFPDNQRWEHELGSDQKGEDNNTGLLRALRLSQSRARESEQKLAAASAKNDEMTTLLLKDSLILSAHRRWVMMLEAENSMLRSEGKEEEPSEGDDGTDAVPGGTVWWVAFALCLGIAGVSFALGKFLF